MPFEQRLRWLSAVDVPLMSRSRLQKSLFFLIFGLGFPLADGAVARPAEAAQVKGTLQRWHRVELEFQGPSSTETSNSPNPFVDFRLQCRFTGPSGQVYDVPGFYDGNGTGGASGSVWKCRLAPDQGGHWSYTASFRSGTQVGVSTVASDGTATSFNGDAGGFDVAESDKSGADFRAPGRGLLINDGGHYLVFRGSGKLWLKGGTNIPENFLGYNGFDNTPNAKHSYSPHAGDWKTGDPDWGGGKGKNIIGALNSLAASGGNNVYFLPMNIGGDGQDTFPTVAAQDKTHYDTSKLAQWEQVFTHADKLGIFMHFQLAETETGNENYYDGGNLGVQRKLFYRELIARFGHHLGLEWDLGEENDYGTTKRKAFAAWIRSVDPYDHPVTTHCHTNAFEEFYGPLLGSPSFAMTAFQSSTNGSALGSVIRSWRDRSDAADVPWVISVDEPQPIENDLTDESRGYPNGRRKFLWPTYMAGGGGFEWYIQENGGGHGFDQRIDDFNIIAEPMRWTRIARDFLLGLPLVEMTPRQALSNAQYTLAAPGKAYAMYNDTAKTVSVDLASFGGKQFAVTWLNPRSGEKIADGTVTGGGVVDLGSAPFGGDAAVSLVATGGGGGGGTTTTTTLGNGTTTTTTGGGGSVDVVQGPECPAVPRDDCLLAAKSKIKIRGDDARAKKIVYRWKRGEALSSRDLGLPETPSGYAMCFYDDDAGTPTLVGRLAVPSGDQWHPSDSRTFYRDSTGANTGVNKIKIKSGVAGRSVVSLFGRSEQLEIPDPATSDLYFFSEPSVVVQFSSTMDVCTESRFTTFTENDGVGYVAIDR